MRQGIVRLRTFANLDRTDWQCGGTTDAGVRLHTRGKNRSRVTNTAHRASDARTRGRRPHVTASRSRIGNGFPGKVIASLKTTPYLVKGQP